MAPVPTVILVRPDGHNESLRDAFKIVGARTLICPLLEIRERPFGPHEKQVVMNLDQFDRVIVVSQNAASIGIKHFDQYWPQLPRLNWYAVGDATATILRQDDIEPIVPKVSSSEGLLALDEFAGQLSERVLICKGVGGRTLIREQLEDRGATVTELVLYERHPVLVDAAIKAEMSELKEATVVLYSAETAAAFVRNIDGRTEDFHAVVPSDRVADVVRELGIKRVSVAESVSDESIVKAAVLNW